MSEQNSRISSIYLKSYRKQFKDRYEELKKIGFCEEAAIATLAEEIEATLSNEDKSLIDIDWTQIAKECAGYFFPS